MHPLVRGFVEDVVEAIELPDPVVEFGARQVEPDQRGDLRSLFAGRAFMGTDLEEGPGVDRLEDLRDLSFGDGEVGTALCLETLEHCADPLSAGRELARVVAPGGACVVSTPMLIGIHGYPNDYFRFTPEGLRSVLGGFASVWVTGIGSPDIPSWVLGVAMHERALDLSLGRLPRTAAAQREWDAAHGKFRVGPLHVSPRELAGIVGRDLPRVLRDRLRRRSDRAG
jgi:SAM-dependent methyltransferase